MSFEDDEYWEDEYSEYSFMPSSAVVQENPYTKRTVPDPVIPTRRRSGGPADDAAVQRAKRAAFDSERPSWLDDPDFEPIDTSVDNLAGDDFDDIDFNRPELGVDFDKPDFPIVDPAARPELRRGAAPQRRGADRYERTPGHRADDREPGRYAEPRYPDDAPARRDDYERGYRDEWDDRRQPSRRGRDDRREPVRDDRREPSRGNRREPSRGDRRDWNEPVRDDRRDPHSDWAGPHDPRDSRDPRRGERHDTARADWAEPPRRDDTRPEWAEPARDGRPPRDDRRGRRTVEIGPDELWGDERDPGREHTAEPPHEEERPGIGRTIELGADEFWEEPAASRDNVTELDPERRRARRQASRGERAAPDWNDEDFGPIRPAGGRRPRRDDTEPRRAAAPRRDDLAASGHAQMPVPGQDRSMGTDDRFDSYRDTLPAGGTGRPALEPDHRPVARDDKGDRQRPRVPEPADRQRPVVPEPGDPQRSGAPETGTAPPLGAPEAGEWQRSGTAPPLGAPEAGEWQRSGVPETGTAPRPSTPKADEWQRAAAARAGDRQRDGVPGAGGHRQREVDDAGSPQVGEQHQRFTAPEVGGPRVADGAHPGVWDTAEQRVAGGAWADGPDVPAPGAGGREADAAGREAASTGRRGAAAPDQTAGTSAPGPEVPPAELPAHQRGGRSVAAYEDGRGAFPAAAGDQRLPDQGRAAGRERSGPVAAGSAQASAPEAPRESTEQRGGWRSKVGRLLPGQRRVAANGTTDPTVDLSGRADRGVDRPGGPQNPAAEQDRTPRGPGNEHDRPTPGPGAQQSQAAQGIPVPQGRTPQDPSVRQGQAARGFGDEHGEGAQNPGTHQGWAEQDYRNEHDEGPHNPGTRQGWAAQSYGNEHDRPAPDPATRQGPGPRGIGDEHGRGRQAHDATRSAERYGSVNEQGRDQQGPAAERGRGRQVPVGERDRQTFGAPVDTERHGPQVAGPDGDAGRERPGAGAEETRDLREAGLRQGPDGEASSATGSPATGNDGPRVVRRAAPPAPPKVVSQATPPPAPRVIKADPPVAPRVVAAPAPVPPARVIGPNGPQPPVEPARPAAEAAAPQSPDDRRWGGTDAGPHAAGAPENPASRRGGPGTPHDAAAQWGGSQAASRAGTPHDPVAAPWSASAGEQAGGRWGTPADGDVPVDPRRAGEAWQTGDPYVTGEIRRPDEVQPDVPQQRSRRSPRAAHVFLAEGDGPWAIIPDETQPPAGSRPVSPARPPVIPGQGGTGQPAPGSAWPPPVRPPAQDGVPSRPGIPVQPGTAAQPVTMGQHGIPVQPGTPTPPGTAGQHGGPVQHGVPVQPGTATQPGTPVQPGSGAAVAWLPAVRPDADQPVSEAPAQPHAARPENAWPPAATQGPSSAGRATSGTAWQGTGQQPPATGWPTPPGSGRPVAEEPGWNAATPISVPPVNAADGGRSRQSGGDGTAPAAPVSGSPAAGGPGQAPADPQPTYTPGSQPASPPDPQPTYTPGSQPTSPPDPQPTNAPGSQPTNPVGAQPTSAAGPRPTSPAGPGAARAASLGDLPAAGREAGSAKPQSAGPMSPRAGTPDGDRTAADRAGTRSGPVGHTADVARRENPADVPGTNGDQARGGGSGGRPTVAMPRPAADPGKGETASRERIGFPLTRPGANTAPGQGAAPDQPTGTGDRPTPEPLTGTDDGPTPDQPYMDADGTLHNLRPIARLETSGPDTEPRRYADSALGSGWFVAKTPARTGGAGTEAGESGDEPPATAPEQPATAKAEAATMKAGKTTAATGESSEGERSEGPELAPHLPLTAADLSAIRWRLDGGTLREVVDDRNALRELGERLDGPLAEEADNIVKAGLLSVRAEVYRLLGELGMAAAAARLALAHAESARDLQSQVIAQAELAHVLRLRGDYMEADRLFQRAVDADVPAAVRSVVHENAGRSCFDQNRHMEALDHFARAIRLGSPEDTDLVERIGVCLEAVYIHVLRDGWGPYPRKSPEIRAPLGARPAAEGEEALTESTAEHPVVDPKG
ncbi:hypothetical protein [Actinoplanes sp. NPDC049802]|uniref:hypothetical protein n=1 Tax=Actinoplanes sp. NPDC049802 TaxID=3154742 RepID=UPI003408A52A